MSIDRNSMSFTTGSLFHRESVELAALYLDLGDWKSGWHLELDEIKPATKGKLRQILFKLLREVDLLTAYNTIKAAIFSPRLLDLIPKGCRRDFMCFPVSESELKGMVL
ncbi:MAG: DUF1819 family protein [Verrucomicrobia bacterium]|nr:DUF1819 family protein [Verrucomicrobiota bacterium]